MIKLPTTRSSLFQINSMGRCKSLYKEQVLSKTHLPLRIAASFPHILSHIHDSFIHIPIYFSFSKLDNLP